MFLFCCLSFSLYLSPAKAGGLEKASPLPISRAKKFGFFQIRIVPKFPPIWSESAMTRRCSHCSHNGHNSRTCPNRGVKLFGVRLTDGSIRKSASMGNLSHYTGSLSHASGSNNPGSPGGETPDHGGTADGYASEDFVPGSSSSRERKKGQKDILLLLFLLSWALAGFFSDINFRMDHCFVWFFFFFEKRICDAEYMDIWLCSCDYQQ